MAGARMQEIADEAKLYKAMCTTTTRARQIFEAVFRQAFEKFAPPYQRGLQFRDNLVFEKITKLR